MLTWSNLSIPNLFFCILLFCKFLMYFIVFISYVFHCFYDFLFLVISSWLISRYKKLCKWPKRQNKHCLVHFKKISNFQNCFVHKPMQNVDFGQILCRRASTKRRVTSRPTVRFSQTWYQKMRKTWKKKVMKRRVAICGGREAVADFVQGGVKLTPPQLR